MRKVLPAALLLISCWLMIAPARHAPDSEISVTVYDSNPSHLWNRVYAVLLVREDRKGHRWQRLARSVSLARNRTSGAIAAAEFVP
jgi:hypothetical protein